MPIEYFHNFPETSEWHFMLDNKQGHLFNRDYTYALHILFLKFFLKSFNSVDNTPFGKNPILSE